jgi:hypothetical protein
MGARPDREGRQGRPSAFALALVDAFSVVSPHSNKTVVGSGPYQIESGIIASCQKGH